MNSYNFIQENNGPKAPRLEGFSLTDEPNIIQLHFSTEVLLSRGKCDALEVELNTTDLPDEDEEYPTTCVRPDGAPFIFLGALQTSSTTVNVRLGFP